MPTVLALSHAFAHIQSTTTQEGHVYYPLFLRFPSPIRARTSPFSAIWRGRNARLTLRVPRASLSTPRGHVHCPLLASPVRPLISPFSAIWRKRNARRTRAPLRVQRASFSPQRRHIHCVPLAPTHHRVLLSVSPRWPVCPHTSLLSAIWRRRNVRHTRVPLRVPSASRMPSHWLSLQSVCPQSLSRPYPF